VHGNGVHFTAAALLLSLAVLAWRIGQFEEHEDFASERFSRISALFALAALGISAIYWVGFSEQQPLNDDESILPAYVSTVQNSVRASRTLHINFVGEVVEVSLYDSTHPIWGSAESNPLGSSPEVREAALRFAQQIADGVASDSIAEELARVGIGHIALTNAPEVVLQSLNGIQGLASAPMDEVNKTEVFTVGGLPSRVLVANGEELLPISDAQIETGAATRRLLLLETPDDNWRVSVNGVELTQSNGTEGYAAFDLASNNGELKWHLSPDWVAIIWQAFFWLIMFAYAAPPTERVSVNLKANRRIR
jgi:hypothetical protein